MDWRGRKVCVCFAGKRKRKKEGEREKERMVMVMVPGERRKILKGKSDPMRTINHFLPAIIKMGT